MTRLSVSEDTDSDYLGVLAAERILLARQLIALALVAASVVTAGATSSQVAALAFAVAAVIASGAGLLGWHRMGRDHPRH